MLLRRESLSPLDGRYINATASIRACCSERALVRYRIELEVKYVTRLLQTLQIPVSQAALQLLHDCYKSVWVEELVDRVFDLEISTQHDVKAVEVAIAERLTDDLDDDQEAEALIPFLHFGLTSQDVNSVAVWQQVRAARQQLTITARNIAKTLYEDFYLKLHQLPMLARTHGQPATPTTLGKEMMVFAERLLAAIQSVESVVIKTKFGGATGGFNAHHLVYPHIDWHRWADDFLMQEFGMHRQSFTTQVEHHDGMAELFDALKRTNTILIDLCRDVWQYISLGYFTQATGGDTTVGSSTMPHKVNPIKMENAEGNLAVANALLELLSAHLPISRMQRDLSGSTVSRNIGVAFGHTMLAFTSIQNGLKQITANPVRLRADLQHEWNVVTEGLQMLLRADGRTDAYDLLKQFSRAHQVNRDTIAEFVDGLRGVSALTKRKMLTLTPLNYIASPYTRDGIVMAELYQ